MFQFKNTIAVSYTLFNLHILRKFYRNAYAQAKIRLSAISFEDSRLQKHLKYLRDQYLTLDAKKNAIYSLESLKIINSLLKDIESLKADTNELDVFISELKGKDEDLLNTAKKEREKLQTELDILKSNVINYLIPHERFDDKDIIMELTSGVGGQEAMLFTKNMFDMYYNFSQWKGWTCEILKFDKTDLGGLKNGHIAISGTNAYKILKYESGVHRVQRVPKTEKAGRIHTSTMTVAVLPQPSEIDIELQSKDLEIEYKHSGGAGGQNVNKTESCVRILHKPSGTVVECQMEREQHKNKKMALMSLRAKLYEKEMEKINKEICSNRKLQVGSAARSEKVRTYNFVQDRITDHRAHINLHNIESFFKGDQQLDKLINQLRDWNSYEILAEILRKYDTEA